MNKLILVTIFTVALTSCTRTVATQHPLTPPCLRVPIVLASPPPAKEAIAEKIAQGESLVSAGSRGKQIGLLLDVSETMREKMPFALESLALLINTLDPQDEVFLLKFGLQITLLQESTRNHALVRNALQEMHVTSNAFPISRGTKETLKAIPGVNLLTLPFDLVEKSQTRDLEPGTKLYDAVLAGVCLVRQGRQPQKAILLVTDGRDLLSSFSLEDILQEIGEREIPVYSILIGDPEARWWGRSWATMDPHVAHSLSEKTKGTGFILNYSEPQGGKPVLTKAVERISLELRQSPSEGFTYVFDDQRQLFEKFPVVRTP